jgi:hypothetical protein
MVYTILTSSGKPLGDWALVAVAIVNAIIKKIALILFLLLWCTTFSIWQEGQ